MAEYVATKAVTIFETVEEAVADLETQLELIVNTGIVRTCQVVKVEGTKWASVVVWTNAVT